ncbi:MAG: iron-containing alcohol dehydrogenase [Tissierella sp.]|uniref:iron-containing alcohol dehydrogenase n=1 Tax=Tissierella sp. TaxID=41274 RepID=UPI003F9C7784
MNSFFYYNPTKIEFGKDSVEQLSKLIGDNHKKVLLHYGGGSIKRSGLYDKVIKILEDKEIEVFELGKVEPNPKLTLVREGIEICKKENISFILAVGGGSVIDSAKVMAVGVEYEGDVWDYFTGKADIESALPLGVVLTIPATGSESSPNAIVTNEDGMLKMGIEHDSIRPEFAILNPKLTLTLPTKQTFAGVVDIISHVHERYFTNTERVELTDGLCESTIRTVMNNGYKLKKDPMDYHARAEIMLSGTMAHSGILGLGREEDWGSHRIAHEMTALYGTTHGQTLSIVLPAWMKYVYKANVDKFVQFAKNVFHVEDMETPEETALEGIKRFEKFLKDMDMPISFTEANIPTDEFELMAEKASKGDIVGKFKKLDKKDIVNILELCK